MMDAVPKISYTVSHSYSRSIRSNIQFNTIEKNMQAMKTDPSIIYMVPDHKKKFFR